MFIDEDGVGCDADFGEAIKALKDGKKVTRDGWNGKGMFLFYVGGGTMTHPVFDYEIDALPYIAMKTATGEVVPWLASQTDLLADDWVIA